MTQPRASTRAQGDAQRGSWPAPTMLKALLQAEHLQNYGMFKRAYQKAARNIDKSLAEHFPSEPTFRRWLSGRVKDLPRAEHCAVLEAMLPGWTAADLFKPHIAPEDDTEPATLLQVLLRHHRIPDYREFCRSYNAAAIRIDKSLVGTYPNSQQFQKWLSGDLVGQPNQAHCAILEAMFPGYTTNRLLQKNYSDPPTSDHSDEPSPEVATGSDRRGSNRTRSDSGNTAMSQPSSSGTENLSSLPIPIPILRELESITTHWTGEPIGRDIQFDRLVQFLISWANSMKRRDVLRTLGWAATAASMYQAIDPDAQARLTSVIHHANQIDSHTIDHIEAILWRCQRQDDALGPQAVLNTVLAQRDLVRTLLPQCPEAHRARMLSVLSNASRHAGWLSFDLNDFRSAEYYYEDARTLAHQAENAELGAFVLCNMSHLATWRQRSRTGIDHAVAAVEWAKRTDDSRLHAYAADVAARAYAADRQPTACLEALDVAETELAKSDSRSSYIYFYDEGLLFSTRSACYLELGEAERAAEYAQESMDRLDKSYQRNLAMSTIKLATARAHSNEPEEAVRLLGDAGEIASCNSSARIIENLRQCRASMTRWESSRAVRELDTRLASYGLG